MTKSDESSKKASKIEIGVEMMTGAAAALLYSDDEIRDVFSKEDADEFIELRRQARKNFAPPKYKLVMTRSYPWLPKKETIIRTNKQRSGLFKIIRFFVLGEMENLKTESKKTICLFFIALTTYFF